MTWLNPVTSACTVHPRLLGDDAAALRAAA
jgi:hypothetical protein